MDVVAEMVEAGEDVAALQAVEPLTFAEWLDRAIGLFTMILNYIMRTPPLRFFAAFGLFWAVVMLSLYLLRVGRTFSR